MEVFDWCSTVLFHIFHYILLLQEILRCLDKCNIQGGAMYKVVQRTRERKVGWALFETCVEGTHQICYCTYLLRYRSRKTV